MNRILILESPRGPLRCYYFRDFVVDVTDFGDFAVDVTILGDFAVDVTDFGDFAVDVTDFGGFYCSFDSFFVKCLILVIKLSLLELTMLDIASTFLLYVAV
ncbi:hypothetical protein FXO38_14096 [Capsicum annuum]|nr:hypothetical protein FXO38_14096 [Capsicum annuum]